MSIIPLFVMGVISAALMACIVLFVMRRNLADEPLPEHDAIVKPFLIRAAQRLNGSEPKRRLTRRVRTRNGLSVALGHLFAELETTRSSRAR